MESGTAGRKVKGVYANGVVKLHEPVEEPEGAEVEVVFAPNGPKGRCADLLPAANATRGIWAGDERIDRAFTEVLARP